MTKIQEYSQILSSNIPYSQDYMIQILEKVLSNNRYNHVMRVLKKAKEIAMVMNFTQMDELIQAVLFHDFSKGMSNEELYSYALEKNIDISGVVPAMYHAVIGTWIAQEYFHIKNRDILDAIFYHTTGYIGFIKNNIGMILFLADYLEPGRKFDKQHIEQFIPNDMNQALYIIVKEKLISVLNRNRFIAQESINFYHSLLELMG